MSLFDTNIAEEQLWVNLGWKFVSCTPSWKVDSYDYDDVFNINFSKTKIVDTLRGLLKKENGEQKMNQYDFDELNQSLEKSHTHSLNKIYSYIILICLCAPSLSERWFSDTLTSCLKQTKLRQGDKVKAEIKQVDAYTLVHIQVKCYHYQSIKIVLEKRNS